MTGIVRTRRDAVRVLVAIEERARSSPASSAALPCESAQAWCALNSASGAWAWIWSCSR